MVTQDSTVTGLLNLIAELRAREIEQEQALEQTRQDIQAVQRALALLRARNGLPAEETTARIHADSLRGKTYLEAIMAIAKANNGIVKVTEAKRFLLEAGVAMKPKTAYQIITGTIIRSERFERIAPGQYKLVREEFQGQPSRPSLI